MKLEALFKFFREVRFEGKRVNWPTREKTIKDTTVVIVFTVLTAVLLSTFDYAFQFFLSRFVF